MIYWNIEKALNLAGVQIHRKHAIGASGSDQVRDQFRRNRGAWSGFAILPGIAVIGNDGGDPARRRAPQLPVIVYPCLVQGAEAPATIEAALRQAGARGECDALLLVRGGGSIVAGHHPVSGKLPVVTANGNHHLLVTPPPMIFAKQNGGPEDTAWHSVAEPFNGFTSVDSTCVVGHPFIYEYQSAACSVSGTMATQTSKDVKALITPPTLGELDINDLLYFLVRFEAGC